MYVINLIANPVKKDLPPALVHSLRNAWGGADAIWLAPDEAAEFSIPSFPKNFWDVWQDCQNMGVDLIGLPNKNRRKKLLLADMDSTLIHQECIDELAAEAGFGERVAEITTKAMNGEIGFEDAMHARVKLLKGLSVSVIAKVLEKRITYMPGGKSMVSTMKAHGAYAALVSGGFTDFTGPVAETLGFDEHRSNTLLHSDGILDGQVAEPILGKAAKVTALNEICTQKGWHLNDAIAVGDGANDLGMLGAAGVGVALHAKPVVSAQCDVRINHGDLTALLYLQGYNRDEFI